MPNEFKNYKLWRINIIDSNVILLLLAAKDWTVLCGDNMFKGGTVREVELTDSDEEFCLREQEWDSLKK